MKSLRIKHDGFILLESITGLLIAMMVILTLTFCVNEQFKLLAHWEERVNAHKLLLLHLQNSHIPDPIIIKDKKYYFHQQENKYQIQVNKNVYQMQI